MKKIILNKGKFALIDDEDFERVNQLTWSWYSTPSGIYVHARTKENYKKRISLHRFIMDAPKDKQVDHIDHNPLNNQKLNLRICTRGENNRNVKIHKNNKSGYKGVTWKKENSKWAAEIQLNYKTIWIGYFNTAIEAAKAYNNAAIKYHGDFAYLNLIK